MPEPGFPQALQDEGPAVLARLGFSITQAVVQWGGR